MKTPKNQTGFRGLRSLALFTACASLLMGCASQGSGSARLPSSTDTAARSAKSEPVRYVEVTGSRIPIRVQGKIKASDLPVNLTVVDPEDPMNRGNVSTLDSLTRNPWASRGYRGY